jgi:hypothetical protein
MFEAGPCFGTFTVLPRALPYRHTQVSKGAKARLGK